MFSRVILTLHIPHFLALSSTFSTLAPMPWQVFSWKFLGMKFHVLQLHWALLLYFFPCFLLFYLLSCEQIKVALDEVVTEGKEVTFKHDVYVDVYVDLLGLMAKCNTSPVHCAKTKIGRCMVC